MPLKDTLYEYKVPLFLIVFTILAFTTFFALTIGLPDLTTPNNNNTTPTPTETPQPTNNTTPTPTPNNTSNQLTFHLQAYEKQLSNGVTLNRTAEIQMDGQRFYYNDSFYYNPNTSLYHNHTAATSNETRRHIEYYYKPSDGYQRQGDQVNPTQLNTTLTDINTDEYMLLRPYLEIQPDEWEQVTPDTYQLETSLQNDPFNPQDGTLHLNATITNETLDRLEVTIKPDSSNSSYGEQTTLIYTLSNYQEPEFYWKSQTQNSTETENSQ